VTTRGKRSPKRATRRKRPRSAEEHKVAEARGAAEAEAYAEECFTKNQNLMVSWFLILSYLYYDCDLTLVSDAFFDRLCKDLSANLDRLSHAHKHLITHDMLTAGTGYNLSGHFPGIVEGAATDLVARFMPWRITYGLPREEE